MTVLRAALLLAAVTPAYGWREWNNRGNATQQRRRHWAQNTGPGGRYGHSMVLFGTQIILFGGRDNEVQRREVMGERRHAKQASTTAAATITTAAAAATTCRYRGRRRHRRHRRPPARHRHRHPTSAIGHPPLARQIPTSYSIGKNQTNNEGHRYVPWRRVQLATYAFALPPHHTASASARNLRP